MEEDLTRPPTSIEVEERTQMLEDLGTDDQRIHKLENSAKALYGDAFPLFDSSASPDDWVNWVERLWGQHSTSTQARLHMVRRNRLFRRGVQWISAVGLGPWREPPKPKDAARVVDNMIAPALDQRLQILTEQRPGFRTRPVSASPSDLKKAEAQQLALEYQWDQQRMDAGLRELAYWAGTDGAAFGELYWDPDVGPWHEFPAPEGRLPLGDIQLRVRRIEQVRVSAESTATKPPWYVVIRDIIPRAQAIREYGSDVVDETEDTIGDQETSMQQLGISRLGYMLPEEDELLREQRTVDRYAIYCDRTEFLPNGLMLVAIGRKLVVPPSPLPLGLIPVFRLTDGSSDPSYFPTPVMDLWIDSQMRVNAVKSKWVENVRYNAGPRLLAKENAISGETLVGGVMSVISAKGLGSLQEIVKPIEGFSLSLDAEKLLAIEKKAFEDLTGWNDTSRGSFSPEQSGRAILAIREQLERIFAPPIIAAARAMTDWAKITLAFMRWGYDIPRTIAVVGQDRPDLARMLSSDDFDGVADVFIDPETLMPMPRALRLYLLQEMLGQGLIAPGEYRRRMPFGWVRNLSTPDEDHEARARRVAEAIRQSGNPMALPVLWQDNEALHQDVLERELILPDDTHPLVRQAAIMRWTMLAQQAQMKMGAVPQLPQAPQRGAGGRGPGPGGSANQPIFGNSPSVAAAPTSIIGGSSDEQRAARAFDARQQT